MNDSDIKNQIDTAVMTLKRDLRYMMYINIVKSEGMRGLWEGLDF